MPDRSLMDRLGNLPVVGGVFVFLTSIGGAATVFGEWCWRKITRKRERTGEG